MAKRKKLEKWISIHAPTRGATVQVLCTNCIHQISIHAPTRGATSINGMDNISIWISIHAPTRGATKTGRWEKDKKHISIHAPTRGATGSWPYSLTWTWYFNPRSHKGSDGSWPYSLTWTWYFNPRSHKGSDINTKISKIININFNPRSHKGSDISIKNNSDNEGISIHAPTRGATPTSSTRIKESGGFQSTLPQGERQLPECFLDCVSLFQSTLPQGERRYQKPVRFWYRNFNPRSHKGSDDLSFDVVDISTKISIHAPTRGATKGQKAVIEAHWKFQSTLPQGERQQFYTKFHICFISFLPILSPYHISTHSPLPTFNHFLYIFSGANRPGISCLLPFRTKTISGIL